MTIPKQSTEFQAELDRNARITEIKPGDKPDHYQVMTKSESVNAVLFPDIEKETLIEALRKQKKLDHHSECLFGNDMEEYLKHGYEVDSFYKSMVYIESHFQDGYNVTLALKDEGMKHVMETSADALCKALNCNDPDHLCQNESFLDLPKFLDRNRTANFHISAYRKTDGDYTVKVHAERVFANVSAEDLANELGCEVDALGSQKNPQVLLADQATKSIKRLYHIGISQTPKKFKSGIAKFGSKVSENLKHLTGYKITKVEE